MGVSSGYRDKRERCEIAITTSVWKPGFFVVGVHVETGPHAAHEFFAEGVVKGEAVFWGL